MPSGASFVIKDFDLNVKNVRFVEECWICNSRKFGSHISWIQMVGLLEHLVAWSWLFLKPNVRICNFKFADYTFLGIIFRFNRTLSCSILIEFYPNVRICILGSSNQTFLGIKVRFIRTLRCLICIRFYLNKVHCPNFPGSRFFLLRVSWNQKSYYLNILVTNSLSI